MSSQKQIDANRLNAQNSTGPRTAAGKLVSRLNAVRHNLTGQLTIVAADQHDASHSPFSNASPLRSTPAASRNCRSPTASSAIPGASPAPLPMRKMSTPSVGWIRPIPSGTAISSSPRPTTPMPTPTSLPPSATPALSSTRSAISNAPASTNNPQARPRAGLQTLPPASKRSYVSGNTPPPLCKWLRFVDFSHCLPQLPSRPQNRAPNRQFDPSPGSRPARASAPGTHPGPLLALLNPPISIAFPSATPPFVPRTLTPSGTA